MAREKRIENSIRNFTHGMVSQLIVLFLNFIVRTIFIKYLNIEYLGVNGLFTNILTILSLAELGFGTAMIYSMYEPLAKSNRIKLQALMNLYKKVYRIIGLVVAILGISIIPFMDVFLPEKPDIPHLTFIYLLFLANSVFSYFFAYKRSVLSADQKAYVLSQYRYIFTIFKSIFQILILITTQNFILFLIIQIIATLSENIFISYKVNKLYPYLLLGKGRVLDREEKYRIRKDVEALILSRIGNVMFTALPNILISAIVGIAWVGIYSNYVLITGSVIMILSQILESIRGSLGHFIVCKSKCEQYEMFKKIDFAVFFLFGFSTICLTIFFNPFITLWVGAEYTLPFSCVLVISFHFMIEGLLNSLWMFRTTMGMFTQGKYRHIMSAVANLIFSLLLGYKFGLLGILLGATLARLLVVVWYDPYLILKRGFGYPVKEYYITYLLRLLLISAIVGIILLFNYAILANQINILSFCILICFTVLLTCVGFYLPYRKNQELKYFLTLIKGRFIQKSS